MKSGFLVKEQTKDKAVASGIKMPARVVPVETETASQPADTSEVPEPPPGLKMQVPLNLLESTHDVHGLRD